MPRTVLVAQHDTPSQRLVASCLEDAGYQVLEAGTFVAARSIIERHPPDLLITDVRLDGYNGLQLLATRDKPIPSIVFTNLPDPVLEADAVALGAEYLLKPVSRSTLLARVNALLGGDQPRSKSFTTRRRGARTRLTASIQGQASDCPARIVDISDTGVRLEVTEATGASLPRTFRLTVPPSDTVFEVKAIWKRLDDAGRWVYGATIQGYQELLWRAVVDSKTVQASLFEATKRVKPGATDGTVH